MGPKVSIVIPAYNHSRYIRETIDSVLGQTYKNLEIVVIDDGSTDNTRETLRPYIQGQKIRYFYQENQGLSAARNAGLKHSTGAYVKFLDSDDVLYPEQIEKQVEDLTAANDEQAMSMTNFCMMGPSGNIAMIDVPMVERHLQLAHFFESNRGGIHTYLFPRKMVEQIGGFNVELKACEDLDLKLRLILRGAYVRKIGYNGCCYRLVDTSMSNDTLHMFLEKCKVYEKVNDALLNRGGDFTPGLIETVLRKNSLLIYECVARRLDMDRILPRTIRLTGKWYRLQMKGAVKFLYECLGIKNYSRLRYLYRNRIDKGYRDQVLNQEISWKIP